MPLFKTATHKDIWQIHWCDRCFHNNHCKIQDKAFNTGHKPTEWTPGPRTALMQDAYRCSAYTRRSPRKAKPTKDYEDVPMFDMGELDHRLRYVPAKGWPERGDEVDHA